MDTIITLIPDVEILLTLSAEELAYPVLQLCYLHKQHSSLIHIQTIPEQVNGNQYTAGYPDNRRSEAKLAVAEAWNWLCVQGLLIPDSNSGVHGWMRFSRRALQLLDKESFDKYRYSVAMPRSFLHPSIADDIWLELARGDYDSAVFKAFKAVEVSVREAGNFPDTDYGVPMMRKAFDPSNGILTDPDDVLGEREALAHLVAGAIGCYKNPQSHRAVNLKDAGLAQEMVILASHILRIIDTRKHH